MSIFTDSKHVKFKKHSQLREAQEGAIEEAANTAGFQLSGFLFRQGDRNCISAPFPVKRVMQALRVNSPSLTRAEGTRSGKGAADVSEVMNSTNRPVIPEHVTTIAEYLNENVGRTYILPPMTLNVRQPEGSQPISLHVPDWPSDTLPVYMVVPMSAQLSVTDGGHRTAAIIKAYDQMGPEDRTRFDRDSVAVMITLEGDITRVHQDFADCSKTKALPPSQLAAYDRRNPANGLVLDLIRSCHLFIDKIDATSKTLSKNSPSVFITNNVRQMVKELLIGDYGMADPQFESKAKDLLGLADSDAYNRERDQFVSYINRITKAIPVLREISELRAGLPRTKIREFREQGYVCLTATGLVMLGRIGHELFKDENRNWTEVADRFSQVDWSKDGHLWHGSIMRAGKITTQRAPVRVATEKLRRALGLTPNKKLDAELSSVERGEALPSDGPSVEEAA